MNTFISLCQQYFSVTILRKPQIVTITIINALDYPSLSTAFTIKQLTSASNGTAVYTS